MQTFKYTFAAGETKVLPSGKFFMILESSSGVDVVFKRRESSIDETSIDVPSGYWVELDQKFDSVRITSATAQTCKFATSDGKGGVNTTSTTILGDVSVGGAAGVSECDALLGSVAAGIAGNEINTTLLLGAANANGMDIVSCHISSVSRVFDPGGTQTLRVYADPLGVMGGSGLTNPLFLTLGGYRRDMTSSGGSRMSGVNDLLSSPIRLPAGWGLALACEAPSGSLFLVSLGVKFL